MNQSKEKFSHAETIALLAIIIPIIFFGVFMIVILPYTNENIPRIGESSYAFGAREQGYPYQISEHCFSQYKTIHDNGYSYSCWGNPPRDELIQNCMTYHPMFTDNKTAQKSLCEMQTP